MTDLINYLKSQMDTDADFAKVDIEYIPCIIEALEKQIPEKPIKDIYYKCPSCNKEVLRGRRCDNNDCGQAIDWSDDND